MKEDGMREIGRSNGVFVVYGWWMEGWGLRIREWVSVEIINGSSGNDRECRCWCREEIGRVSEFIGFVVGMGMFLRGGGGLGGREEEFGLGYGWS